MKTSRVVLTLIAVVLLVTACNTQCPPDEAGESYDQIHQIVLQILLTGPSFNETFDGEQTEQNTMQSLEDFRADVEAIESPACVAPTQTAFLDFIDAMIDRQQLVIDQAGEDEIANASRLVQERAEILAEADSALADRLGKE